MPKKIIALMLCVISLLSVSACSQNDETADDFLLQISGTYVELFPEMSNPEYRDIWLEAVTPIVGADNADIAVEQLIGHCTAEIYGAEAVSTYADDPDSTRFDCYFIGGVTRFVMDGHTIQGLDETGNEVFSHTYEPMDVENENGFIFYQTHDADAGQFTYFAFLPDTMDTTYHLEFRYSENQDDLQSWFEGNYAYWNAAAIAADYSEQTMHDVIHLFAEENLTSEE